VSAAPVASLSATLLVTKGNAQPSRGLAQPMTERLGFALRAIPSRDYDADNHHEAHEPVTPVKWPVRPAFVPPSPVSSAAHSRITVRVDDIQRLRLRLASAHLGKSRQVILLEALDHYFKRVLPAFLHDPCPCIQGGSAIGSECCQGSVNP
jgi:hypothetical protein